MDFTSFAAIEFADAFEAEREHEREQRKWLIQWQDLQREADARKALVHREAVLGTRRAA
jgi:hypothetical protein